jgi:hypothetical protein
MEDSNKNPYNWTSFYQALCRHGPDLLLGVDEDLIEVIKMSAADTDMFWSDGLEECLAIGAADGDMRVGVLSALDLWRENVLDALSSSFGIDLDWEMVSIDEGSPLINQLVQAALPGKAAPPHLEDPWD